MRKAERCPRILLLTLARSTDLDISSSAPASNHNQPNRPLGIQQGCYPQLTMGSHCLRHPSSVLGLLHLDTGSVTDLSTLHRHQQSLGPD
jgi:hypothetical protein